MPDLRPAVALAPLVLLALGAGTAGAPAHEPSRARGADVLEGGLWVGIQDDRLPVADALDVDDRIDQVAGAGARVTRVDVLWSDVAPTPPADPRDPNDPAYRWDRYDRLVDGFARRGVAVILNVYRTPDWANGGRGVRWAPDAGHHEAFMAALAARYDGRTPDRWGRAHAGVTMFEPWNEPNLPFFLQPQWAGPPGAETPASPAIYAGLLTGAYRAVKQAQPDAVVIGVTGGPVGRSAPPSGGVGIVDFVRALAAFAPPLDAVSQHLYPALGPSASAAMPSYRRLDELVSELDRLRPGAPVLITELGWTTSASIHRPGHVSEVQQAAHLREALGALARHPRVNVAIWFNMQDNVEWPSGLLRADGTEKPAWGALTRALRRAVPTP